MTATSPTSKTAKNCQWYLRRSLSRGETRWYYAESLYRDESATLDDRREAATTFDNLTQTARRVLGGAHPFTKAADQILQDMREALRACEGAVESLSEAVAEMMPGDAKDELLGPTA